MAQVTLMFGIILASTAVIIWARDLSQLLRGRLGPRKAAAPEYWLLLISLCGLGVLGAHRLLLRRYRSALLFPLLLVIGGFCAIDALTGKYTALLHPSSTPFLPSYHPTILPSYHLTILPSYHLTSYPSYR